MNAASQRGYALLAALVVTALAALFAATVVAAVSSRQSIVSADAAGDRTRAAAREALVGACLELRRHPAAERGELTCPGKSSAEPGWHADWVPAAAPAPHDRWPAVALEVQVTSDSASRRLSALLSLRAERVPQGLVCSGDVELEAPVRVTGSGLYCGGCLRGREWLDFRPAAGSVLPAADGVHADLWPAAGVHALGGVWSAGEEIHAAASLDPEHPYDTDMHTGGDGVRRFVLAPDPSLIVSLRDDAVAPGEALRDGVLDLAGLPAVRPFPGGVAARDEGYAVVVLVDEGVDLRLVGVRPPGACPLVLAVVGDATVGRPDLETSLEGALLVTGRLTTDGPTYVGGHLYAGSIVASAALSVAVGDDWRRRPLAGLVAPAVVRLDGP